jgi:hypothetical protein
MRHCILGLMLILEYHWLLEEIVEGIQLEHGYRPVSVPTIHCSIYAGLLNPYGLSAKFMFWKLHHHGKRHRKKKEILETCSAQKEPKICDVLLYCPTSSINGSAEPMKTPISLYRSSSPKARMSRTRRGITSNGSTIS